MDINLEFEITQDDINKGIEESHCYCPAAIAIKRANPTVEEVSVFVHTTEVWYKGKMKVFENDPYLQAFVESYDQGNEVKGGNYSLIGAFSWI